MPTVTIRPNAVYEDSGTAWTNVGGAASREAAMADGSNVDLTGGDTTYMKGRSNNGDVIKVKFASPNLPANARITDIKTRVRIRKETDSTGQAVVAIDGGVLRSNTFVSHATGWSMSNMTTSFTNYTSPSWPLTTNSGSFSGTDISSPAEGEELEVYISIGYDGVDKYPSIGIAGLALDVTYIEVPLPVTRSTGRFFQGYLDTALLDLVVAPVTSVVKQIRLFNVSSNKVTVTIKHNNYNLAYLHINPQETIEFDATIFVASGVPLKASASAFDAVIASVYGSEA